MHFRFILVTSNLFGHFFSLVICAVSHPRSVLLSSNLEMQLSVSVNGFPSGISDEYAVLKENDGLLSNWPNFGA